jgi:tetratricopeptide (TPR) repeat protein
MRACWSKPPLQRRRTQLQAVTSSRPELAEPWLLLGSLQMQAKQDAAAETSIKRFIELSGSQANKDTDATDRKRSVAQAYFALSQLAERRKDYAAAERWLSRVDGAEEIVAAQTRRAALLARQGKLPQAREVIRACPSARRKTRSRSSSPKCSCCATQSNTRRPTTCWPGLAAAPDDSDLVYDQAMVAEKLNRLDDMERLLRRLIELKPESQNAYNALGYSFADRKIRLDEARTLIQKAVQLAPDDPFIADSLGWVEFRLGNTDEAIRILEAAYKTRPDPRDRRALRRSAVERRPEGSRGHDLEGSAAERRRERDPAGNAQAPAGQAISMVPQGHWRRPRTSTSAAHAAGRGRRFSC